MSAVTPPAPILSPAIVQKLFPYVLGMALGGGTAGAATGLMQHPQQDQDRLVERVTILEVRMDTLIEGTGRIEDLLREISAQESRPR
jgi:hypothetical protein